MLIQFRVENHRSLRDEASLSLVAADLDITDPRLIRVSGLDEALLPVAAIYGANASGKSNLLNALAYMQGAVINSQRLWPPDEGVHREPFAFSSEAVAKESLFEVDFLLSGVRHRYGFTVDDNAVREEWLYAWPRGKRQSWFEREGQHIEFGKHLHGNNRIAEDQTRFNSLFLSAAAQANHAQLLPLYRWFGEVRIRSQEAKFGADSEPMHRLIESSKSGYGRAMELLRRADLGIVDARVDTAGGARSNRRLMFRHQAEGATRDTWLPLSQESMGTIALVGLLPALTHVLDAGGLLVVDELDASLHPAVAVDIVRLFQDPARNPRRAQLIFNTHDTTLLGNLLGDPPLRRDQIWLAEKRAEGATVIYPLTDFHPRKVENLERGYLQGRYGAIPFLGDFSPTDSEEG